MIILVIGGTDSGKSKFAEKLAYNFERNYNEILYIATYKNLNNDPEMIERIKEHKKRRDKNWKILEISKIKDIAKEIKKISNAIVIIESITMLVSYELMVTNENNTKNKKKILKNFENLIKAMKENENKNLFILVSNEVGMGITPENKISRTFEYILGRVNQILAEKSNEVYLVVAGMSVLLKR